VAGRRTGRDTMTDDTEFCDAGRTAFNNWRWIMPCPNLATQYIRVVPDPVTGCPACALGFVRGHLHRMPPPDTIKLCSDHFCEVEHDTWPISEGEYRSGQ